MKKIIVVLMFSPFLVLASDKGIKSDKKLSIKAEWIIHPSGQCVKAESPMSLSEVLNAYPSCVFGVDKDLIKGLTLLDCSKSDLGVKLIYADTLPTCKKAVGQAKAAGEM